MTRKSNQYNRIRKLDADEQRAKRASRHGGSSGSQPRVRIYRDTQSAPTSLMGGIIGKGGAHIKTIVADAGPSCRIWSDKDKVGTFQITAPSQATIARAKQLIRSKICELQAQDLQKGLLQNQKGSIRERRRQKASAKDSSATEQSGFQMKKEDFPTTGKESVKKKTPTVHSGSYSALDDDSESDVEEEERTVQSTPSTGSWVKPLQVDTTQEEEKPKPKALVQASVPVPPAPVAKLERQYSWGAQKLDNSSWAEMDDDDLPSLLPPPDLEVVEWA